MKYSTILEPLIEVKSDTGASILVLFDTGSSAAWFANSCPGQCAQVMQQNCPHCQGWQPRNAKDISQWSPPMRDQHCQQTGQQVPLCFSCQSPGPGSPCQCGYGGCGSQMCQRGACSVSYNAKAAKVIFTDANGKAFGVCAAVGEADGNSYAVNCGGLSGILGMWDFTSPFLNPQHILYSIYMHLGPKGQCLPKDILNFSYDSWVDSSSNIQLKAVIQDSSVAKSTDVHEAALIPSQQTGFYIIQCNAIKIGTQEIPLSNQTFILDTGTAAGGNWSPEIWCAIQQNLPSNLQIPSQDGSGPAWQGVCQSQAPQSMRAGVGPQAPVGFDAPTISFRIQGSDPNGGSDFWWTFRPQDYIFAMDALQQGKFTSQGNQVGYLFMNQAQGLTQPNQSLLGNLNFLNHSLTFDFLRRTVSFRNLNSNGQVVSKAAEAVQMSRQPPRMGVSGKMTVPLPRVRGPERRPQVHIPDVPIETILEQNMRTSATLAAATADCCRDPSWPGCA